MMLKWTAAYLKTVYGDKEKADKEQVCAAEVQQYSSIVHAQVPSATVDNIARARSVE